MFSIIFYFFELTLCTQTTYKPSYSLFGLQQQFGRTASSGTIVLQGIFLTLVLFYWLTNSLIILLNCHRLKEQTANVLYVAM